MTDEVKNLAGQYFKEGYNCSEAILRAFREALKLDVSDEALKMGGGFGGGIGHAGCVCGALAGSVMVLGMLQGRTDKSQSRNAVYSASEEFHRRFSERFGGSCCRILNPHPFETKDHLRNCLKLTGNTAGLLMEYIEEKKLSGVV
ncbi:MAG: C-GCAxxG-C-C family (seleno)protein [Negativicutes bacterium]|nr:C-GCAxxG-C-C family (seleno)protein [Negativicutes bacterium]